MSDQSSTRIGGPDAPYRQDQATIHGALVTPMRLTRMLKLYVATHEGLTQKRVAQEAGISESSLSRFLGGEHMLDGRSFASLLSWCLGDHTS